MKWSKVSSESFRSTGRGIATSCTVDKKLQPPLWLPAFHPSSWNPYCYFGSQARRITQYCTSFRFFFNLAIMHSICIRLGNLLAGWGWCKNPSNTAVWVWPHFQSLFYWSCHSQCATPLPSPSNTALYRAFLSGFESLGKPVPQMDLWDPRATIFTALRPRVIGHLGNTSITQWDVEYS